MSAEAAISLVVRERGVNECQPKVAILPSDLKGIAPIRQLFDHDLNDFCRRAGIHRVIALNDRSELQTN